MNKCKENKIILSLNKFFQKKQSDYKKYDEILTIKKCNLINSFYDPS